MDYEAVCYKRPFLRQVIARVDFLEFIPSELLFSESIVKSIMTNFTQVGMRQVMRYSDVSVVLNNKDTQTTSKNQEGFKQEFSNMDRNKLTISNRFVILEINNYTSYEDLHKLFSPVLKAMGLLPINSIRTGIRYINIIDNNVVRLTKSLFNKSISHLVNTNLSKMENGVSCIRSMCMNEYQVEDMRLNFRYGMFNPEYPSPMRSAQFVLDFDCYCESLLTGHDAIMSHIDEGHNSIQYLFENAITDNLRKVMNNE